MGYQEGVQLKTVHWLCPNSATTEIDKDTLTDNLENVPNEVDESIFNNITIEIDKDIEY